jgi:predicted ATP-dependent endonuclease of OLD family
MPETLNVPILAEKETKAKVSLYEVGVQELHRVAHDDEVRRQVDHEFNEARGRDGARLYVTLRSLNELDRRVQELASDVEERFAALEKLRDEISREIRDGRAALSNQQEASLQSITTHAQESADRLAVDVRKLRDEVVSLVDSRMNQADASFAALRGDVEVVKYLVMDLIKDRIGRSDPKSKSF